MKKLVAIFVLVASALSVGLGAIGENELNKMRNKCENDGNFNSCKRLCDLKDGKGCFFVGTAYQGGVVVKKDYSKALYYLKMSCDKFENAYGCIGLARLYGKGVGVEKDEKKELEIGGKACELGLDEVEDMGGMCFLLGYEYEREMQDYAKAKRYYELACKAESRYCDRLGKLYEKGQGTKQDFAKAYEYYKLSCDLKNGDGCYNLGNLYDNGLGVQKDRKTAFAFFRKACDLLDYAACKIVQDRNDPAYNALLPNIPQKQLQESCENGDMGACATIGIVYINKDRNIATKYLARACARGEPTSCLNLGTLYKVDKDTIKANRYFKRACYMGESVACCELEGKQNCQNLKIGKDGKPINDLDKTQSKSSTKPMVWTILFYLLDKILTFALSFLIVGGIIKALLLGAFKVGMTSDKDLLTNKTAAYVCIILSVLLAILAPKMLARALYF